MATIKFFIQSKNNPAGIYVRLKEGRKIDAKAKTKYAINPEDWSSAKGQPKSLKQADFKELNESLLSLSSALLNQFNKSGNRETINSKWLKDFINPPLKTGAIPETLLEYLDYFATHKKSEMKTSTYKKLQGNRNLIERFQVASKRVYFIKDVNADFKLAFEGYCKKELYALNTIARVLKFIKTICYHARNNGVESHFQLSSIKSKTEKVQKVFLSKEEIEIIKRSDKIQLEHLKNARDWLIISCETGQRVSDFMRFNKDQIRYEDAVPLIEFTQIKTEKLMAIPLSKAVRKILKSRNGDFPRKISDQRYNEYIKEVCRLAGIEAITKGSKIDNSTARKKSGHFPKYELVASHIGRRSFATNHYGDIPTALLMQATGHSTEKMFLEYIGKTVTEKAKQLAEYFK